VMSVSVCVCLSAIISSKLHVRSSLIFVHVTYVRGSVLLWQHSDMVRISGFVDDVIFSHKLRLFDVAARLWLSWRSGLPLAVRAYYAAVGVSNIYDIMFAHNVPAYIATRK